MRRANDQYFTPEFATSALLDRVAVRGSVLECCSGDNDISDALHAYLYLDKGVTNIAVEYVLTNDIDPSFTEADHHLDATLSSSWAQFPRVDWVVSNPPFSLAPKIIPLAFSHARVGVAMLLRKSYTEPCFNRAEWLLNHRERFANQIFLPRISFTGDGKTDNVACDWYVWTKKRVAGCQVDWVLR